MIGIVVVSHSRALAEAAVGLATEMVDEGSRPPIALAAGLDATTFGTDAAAVAEAIGSVDSADGVLVLLDLGSAVLSAEMALEFLDPDVAAHVVVSSAPLVEGLVAAVVLASTGADIGSVADEAMHGLSGKQDHLGVADSDVSSGPTDSPEPAAPTVPREPDATAEIVVTNAHGLHARPAARLVSLVRSFDATVTLTDLESGRGPVDAGSLSRVATLDARHGDRLRVEASGRDAAQLVDAVRGLAERSFGDEDVPASQGPPPRPAAGGSGLEAAIGPAVVPVDDVDAEHYVAGSVDEERSRSARGVQTAAESIERIQARTRDTVGGAAAEIFDAQLALLSDASVLESVESQLAAGASAPEAWTRCLRSLADEFEALADPYQRERAQDVRSVQRTVVAALTGNGDSAAARGDQSGVLIVPELDAATAASLDTSRVTGVVTLHGGNTGHGVIVVKSRGVPVITDVGEAAAGVHSGTVVAFDARSGEFVVDPDAERRRQFEALIRSRTDARERAQAHAAEPAVTTDGCRVTVAANVNSAAEAAQAVGQGAEGSGLVRTEVLFGQDTTRPSVERQTEMFLAIAAALEGRPMTIRTWDVGGDKPLAFLPQPIEANPFLGERGLRMFRRRPDILDEQLRAICLTARETPTRVMFPMVTTPEEVDWALQRLHAAEQATTGARPSGLEVGVMIEVPAAALRAGRVAGRLDFVSIGTNDLTSYTTAAERGNSAVSGLADGLEPAVLQLIELVCREVPEHAVVAVCGDLASRAEAAALLVGLGVRELSAVAPRVPDVKAAIRAASLSACREIARRAVDASSAADVRLLLADAG